MQESSAATTREASDANYLPQTLSERWELDADDQDGILKIKAYQPVYILPAHWRNDVNVNPCSPNPDNCATGTGANYENWEATFQLSGKMKAWQDIFGSSLDLWMAYSQQSFWQVYDTHDSRPFRENNLQPEAWVTVPLAVGPEWLRWRMLNLGLLHDSNAQSDPLSRSWNRVYASFGFTAGDTSIMIKPWWRLPEKASTDNNPDISDYVGRIELQVIQPFGGHVVSARLRNNLKFGSSSVPNRTSVELDWAFPLRGALHGYMQVFDGWGESLQNYNFHNTTVGIGVSLVQWR